MRSVIGFFLICFLALNSCKENASKSNLEFEGQKPNVILIMADDQGWGDLSVNGNANLTTPHIDAIANGGVTFENFYVQPVCSPTRAELLTGRYAPRLGVYDTSAGGERMNLGETTIAQVFQANGYSTAAFGKWHNGMQPPYHPNARGFDDFYGFASGHWGNYFDPVLEHNGLLVRGDGFLPDDLTRRAINFMENHKENPFFLYIPYNTPHSPMQVPDQYWDRFTDKKLVNTYKGEGEEELDFTKAALAMVKNIDDNVGKVMATLRKLELEENTIVIFMSDNGPNNWRWNGGMKGKKGSTDEGGVRSPFFMQWKGRLPAGQKLTHIASGLDLLPTLADLAHLSPETNSPLDGKSLKPLFLGKENDWRPRVIYNHWNEKTSVRSQDYRLDSENRLYNIDEDRGQKKDLSKSLPDIRDSLIQLKSAWLADVSPESVNEDNRPFTLGHPDHIYTQIPARDGIPHGNIKRSNRHPNNTFFTNWNSLNDSITWDVDVLESATYQVSMLYTLAEKDKGVGIRVSHGKNLLVTRIGEGHETPLTGMENDRVPRIESYIKDFKPKILGKIYLRKGRRPLVLKALHMSGNAAMDVRLLFFKRID